MHSKEDATEQPHEAASSTYYDSPRIFPLVSDGSERMLGDARVLLFSQRNIERPVWHGPIYEFEDVILSVENAQMLAPHRRGGARAVRVARRLRADARRRLGLTRLPESESIHVDGQFDLFFAVLHFAWQATYLRHINWRRQSRKAVCFILELWSPELDEAEPYLKMLREFDQIFVFQRWSIPRIREITRTRVDYLPIGADAHASCPYPACAPRTINVFSMGRRVPHVHKVMLRLMEQEQISYIFDSVSAGMDPWIDHREHRALLRHLFRRSRYVLAFRQNDSPNLLVRTGGEEAIPNRYFESIAGGPVILGSEPNCSDFRANFDWPDAMIPLPSEAPAIEETLRSLDSQPERVALASATNVVNALRRHDWVYRWRAVLAAAGLSETPALGQRIANLQSLAELALARSGTMHV